MNDDKINGIFGAETEVVVLPKALAVLPDDYPVQSTKNDSYVDNGMKAVVDTIDDTIGAVISLAEIQESARGYEVLSTLLKTKIDAIQSLANIERDKRKVANNTQINIGTNALTTPGASTNINEILKNIK